MMSMAVSMTLLWVAGVIKSMKLGKGRLTIIATNSCNSYHWIIRSSMFSHNIYNLATLCNYDVRIKYDYIRLCMCSYFISYLNIY